ncbi:hypothetical protein KUC_3023 [Vreelandella boliviensis LC1]|nr:hypothetical protein KUC_3023 [Halomonas boliviensis LC1]
MMLNVSAAVLASELSKIYYFEKDETGLVWDKNKPNKKGDSIFIPLLYAQQGVIENITITLVDTIVKNDIVSAIQFIEEKHEEGLHLICGNSSHSLLISGEVEDTYFVWDPDTSWNNEAELIRKNLAGEHSIQWLYSNYGVEEEVEFWVYSVKICT